MGEVNFPQVFPEKGQELVYFISHDDAPIKIGKAVNVLSRLKALQTGFPHQLEILGVMCGDVGLELRLHRKFHALRIRGEWFKRDEKLLEFIEKNADTRAVGRLERQALPSNEVKRAAREKIKRIAKSREITLAVEKFEDDLAETVEEVLRQILRCINEFNEVLHGLDQQVHALCGRRLRREQYEISMRRIVDKAYDCNWQESKAIMAGDRDIAKANLKTMTRKILRSAPWFKELM